MADITDWMSLAEPNEEWEDAVKQMGQRPDLGAFPDIATLRGFIAQRMTSQVIKPTAGVHEKDHQIPTRDNSTITVRTYHPEGKSGCPLAVIFHGGGWCVGGLENEQMICRRISGELGVVAVNVDYRLAPEHKFPTAVLDGHDATKWAAANAKSLGADPSKGFIVGGTSAGGNIAAVVALLCRDEKLSPPLTGCHLEIPALCADVVVPEKYKADYGSWDQNKNADILSRKAIALFGDNYVTSEARKDPMFSPLVWKTGLAGFPTTTFQICGADPLRDEALIFERELRVDHKVKTLVKVYPGLPHGYWAMAPTLPVSDKYNNETVDCIKWLLAQV